MFVQRLVTFSSVDQFRKNIKFITELLFAPNPNYELHQKGKF